MSPVVVDLSHHNVIPESLQPANDAGILGVIHKATEGTTYKDTTCAARLYLARQAGMLFGTYHFMRPGDPGDQVAFYYDTVQNLQSEAGESRDWLWACDFEDEGIALADVASFLEQLEAVTHQSPVLYSGHVLKDALKGGAATPRLTGYRLWLAQYASSPELPPGWERYWLWQYSDQGKVPGINPPCDVNAYDGPVSELVAGWAGNVAPPAPAPEEIEITITVASPVPVRVVVLSSTSLERDLP
jgi:lysozyme